MKQDLPDKNEAGTPGNGGYRLAFLAAVVLNVTSLGFGLFMGLGDLQITNGYLYYLVYPLVCIVLYRMFGRYFVVLSGRREKNLGLIYALMYPQMLFIVGTYSHYQMMEYWPLFLPDILFALVFTAAFALNNKKFARDSDGSFARLAGICLLGLILGFGFSYLYNVSGTQTEPVKYDVTLDHRYLETKQGKHGTYNIYHIVVKPWQYSQMTNDFTVNKTFYNNLNWDKPISIQVFTGKLGAPWYKVWGYYVTPGP